MKTTKNFWRIVTLALALVMMFSVVACGNKEEPAATSEEATAAPSAEAPTTATTEKPTTGTTAPTTQPTTGTTAPTTEPTTGTTAPTTEPTTEGTGTAGGEDPVDPPVDNTPDVWDGVTVDTSWFNKDDIKEEYTLTTAAQFAGFFKLRQNGYKKEGVFAGATDRFYFEGVTIKLGRDIVLNEGATAEDIKALAALGQARQVEALHSGAGFKGVFDGQGHTIKGVFLDCTSSGVKALFGGIGDNGVFKNFTVETAYFNAAEKDKHTGAIVFSRANGTNILISNVTVKGALLEESTALFSGVGILLGKVDAGKSVTIENCHTSGVINFPSKGTNNYAFGGIVGYVDSGADGVTPDSDGNIAPASTTTLIMKNCSSDATITGTNIVGGLVGKAGERYELTMDYKCKFTGTLTVTEPGDSEWKSEYIASDLDFKPTQPTIIPEFTGEDFSSLKFPEFENATIVIDGANCEAGSVVMTNTEGSKYHIFNKDNNAGAAAHGVYKLIQDGIFHYYLDPNSVNKTIETEYGADYKIASVDDCYIRWSFTVTEAGTYTVGSYMRIKDNGDRLCQVQFDDQTPLIMHYTLTKDEALVENKVVKGSIQDATQGSYLMWDGVEVYLEAGEHTLTYSIPSTHGEKWSSWHWRTIYLMKKAA